MWKAWPGVPRVQQRVGRFAQTLVGGSAPSAAAWVSAPARRAWFRALVEAPLASEVAALLDDRSTELAGTVPAAPSRWAVEWEPQAI